LEGVVLAPAIWLARARGWRRLVLGLAYLAVMAAGGALLWREARLAGLPSIAEPFEIAKFRDHDVAEGRNAWTYYRRAARMLPARTMARFFDTGSNLAWETAAPEAKSYLLERGPVLAEWRKGTEQDEALLVPRGSWKINTPADGLSETLLMGRLAVLEGSRLRAAGKPAEAWEWLNAALRCSRHLGQNTPLVGRIHGNLLAGAVRAEVQGWLNDPAVELALLQQAMADCLEAQRIEASGSETIQMEYLTLHQTLSEDREIGNTLFEGSPETLDYAPPVRWIKLFALHEPERSKRLAKLVSARWLHEMKVPRAERSHVITTKTSSLWFFGTRAGEQPIGLADEELQQWLEQPSVFLRVGNTGPFVQTWLDRDGEIPKRLALRMAQRMYERAHEGKPPMKLGELLGAYYPATEPFPEGMTAEDPPLP
jgi:hypothetical protein